MRAFRYYFLEPSKVGQQHLTLIEGYLTALASSNRIRNRFELVLCAAPSMLAMLPQELKAAFRCKPVKVMDPEKRRLVIKTLLELFVVSRFVIKLKPGDFLFVSCLLPTTLWMLEVVVRFLGRKTVHVVLHGEIEGIFDRSLQNLRSFGYWSKRWVESRKLESSINLVVLDDFIRDRLTHEFPDKFDRGRISVVHHPVIWQGLQNPAEDRDVPSVCFVGYRSRFKGFDEFVRLASSCAGAGIEFLAIGEGKVENLISGDISPLANNREYLDALSKCSAAVFPYTGLYACSLSAAALDAISVGVRIIAYDRPFFQSLRENFGPRSVTVCESFEALCDALDAVDLKQEYRQREQRLKLLENSSYGLGSVQKSFEALALADAVGGTPLEYGERNEL